MKSSTLAAIALVALLTSTGCIDGGPDAGGDDFGDDTIAGGSAGFPTDPDPDLDEIGEDVPPVDEAVTRAGEVTEKIAALKARYPIDIVGDWTPEALVVLADVLRVYSPKPQVLGNLVSIRMHDIADANRDTGRLLGVYTPATRKIAINGNSLDPKVGLKLVDADTLQHEIGHYFARGLAHTAAWRDAYRAEVRNHPAASSYGAQSFEERCAELWSKMFTYPGRSMSQISWSDPAAVPDPELLSLGISFDMVDLVGQVVDTPIRAELR